MGAVGGELVEDEVLIPPVTFEQIALDEANVMLAAWGHRMGPMERGNVAGVNGYPAISVESSRQ